MASTDTTYTPTCINISSEPGQPSTFWLSESGKYYRTKQEAIDDTGTGVVDPSIYEITKSFWDKNKKYVIIAIVALVLIGGGLWYYFKKVRK